MPIRQNVYAATPGVNTNQVLITGVSAGTSNNRAIFVATAYAFGAQVTATNITYAGSNNLAELTNFGWQEDNANEITVSVWAAYGIDSGSNDLLVSTETAGLDDWSVIGVTFSDTSTNGAPSSDGGPAASNATNTLSSATDRVALSFFGKSFGTAPTLNGDAGHTELTNVTSGPGDFMSLTTVDPAVASTVMGYTNSTAQDSVAIAFDVQGPVAAANQDMVGIG